ncbi:hypothetical protein D3C80_1270200 [compost metagenome]
MQTVVFGQAPPVPPIKTVIAHQAEGHGHWAPPLPGQHDPDRLGHAFGQQAEERPCQVRRLSAHGVGIGIAGVHEIPFGFTELLARIPIELDAMASHLLTLLAHLFALARTQSVEEILKVPIAAVVPVVLATQALQPTLTLAHYSIGQFVGEVDVHA